MSRLEFRTRPASQFAVIGVLAVVVLLAMGWGMVISGVQDRSRAEPVEIEVEGVPVSHADLITFWFTGVAGKPEQLDTYKSLLRWRADGWLPAFKLTTSQNVLQEITKLRITISGKEQMLLAGEVAGWTRTPTPRILSPAGTQQMVTVEVPVAVGGPISVVNWNPDLTLRGEILKNLFWLPLIAAVLLFFHRAATRLAFRHVLARSFTAPTSAQQAGFAWTVSGFLFVAGCLAILELRQPFYFTQDDNYAQFLPVIASACRAVFAGHLPIWNPSQFMGSPVMTLGVYALTYPFTYVAWFLSRYALGNENLTIEVFACGHILAGYFVTARVLRRVGLRPILSTLGAVCFVLSGFSLVFGRSWYYMLPVLVWVPALVLAVENLITAKVDWRWATWTGLVIGLFFHAGNAQMWCYGLMFFIFAITLLLAAKNIPFRKALWTIPAVLIGTGLASPVLLLQMAETSNIDRIGGIGFTGASAILQMILPLGSLVAHPDIVGGYLHSPRGEMFYLGMPFALATLFGAGALMAFLILYRQDRPGLRSLVGRNIWLVCALLAFVLALGNVGILWQIMSLLPVINKFNVPGKFLGFVSLFAVIGGGLILERNLARGSRLGNQILLPCGFGLVLLHVCLAGQSFYDYGAPPYVAPRAGGVSMTVMQSPRRTMAIGPDRSESPYFVESLRNNFPTITGAYAIEGYDPLVSTRPEDKNAMALLDTSTVAAATAYGVRWVVLYKPGLKWQFGSVRRFWPMEVTASKEKHRFQALERFLKPVSEDQYVSIFELPDSSPLAFVAGQETRELPVLMDWSGAHVHTAGVATGSRVVINVLGRPFFHLQSGISWTPDEWGRATVQLQRPTNDLDLIYAPPWGKGLAAGLALILIALGVGMALSRMASVPEVCGRPVSKISERLKPVLVG